MKLAFAEKAAAELLDHLRPACEMAVVAGSVRRQCPDVGDVELVLAPLLVPNPYRGDLFGGPHTAKLDLLTDKLNALRATQTLAPRPSKTGQIAWGQRAVRAVFTWTTARNGGLPPLRHSAPVDLFIVRPPAQWGLIEFIRTGDADFAASGLTRWKEVSGGGWSEGGCLRDRDGQPVPTPTEADVFRALRWEFVPPEQRGQRSKAAGKLELPVVERAQKTEDHRPQTTDQQQDDGAPCFTHDWTGDLADTDDGHCRPTCARCGIIRPPSDLI